MSNWLEEEIEASYQEVQRWPQWKRDAIMIGNKKIMRPFKDALREDLLHGLKLYPDGIDPKVLVNASMASREQDRKLGREILREMLREGILELTSDWKVRLIKR